MILNQDILFIHVPKTGGMAMTTKLLEVLPRPIYYAVPKGHEGKIKDPNIIISIGDRHGNLREAKKWVESLGMSLNSFKKILVAIRNPYDMEVSRYFYLRLGHPWDRGQAQKIALEGDFEKFAVESLYHGRKLSEVEKYFVIEGKMPSNINVLRFENLQTDLKTALLEVGIEFGDPLPVVNKTKHGHYREYLTSKAEQAIYKRYKWLFDNDYYEREEIGSIVGRVM